MSQASPSHRSHVLPLRLYLSVAATLLVLTSITVYVSTIDFGPYNLVVAMVIAALKATLVALFFMHLWYDSKIYLVVFLTAITFLAIFITFTLFDTLARDDIYEMRATPIRENAVIYDSVAPAIDSTVAGDSGLHGDSTGSATSGRHQ